MNMVVVRLLIYFFLTYFPTVTQVAQIPELQSRCKQKKLQKKLPIFNERPGEGTFLGRRDQKKCCFVLIPLPALHQSKQAPAPKLGSRSSNSCPNWEFEVPKTLREEKSFSVERETRKSVVKLWRGGGREGIPVIHLALFPLTISSYRWIGYRKRETAWGGKTLRFLIEGPGKGVPGSCRRAEGVGNYREECVCLKSWAHS